MNGVTVLEGLAHGSYTVLKTSPVAALGLPNWGTGGGWLSDQKADQRDSGLPETWNA